MLTPDFDFFSGSDDMLEAMRSSDSETLEDVGEIEDVEEETPLLKEIFYQLAEIKSMVRTDSSAPTIPDYSSNLLESI